MQTTAISAAIIFGGLFLGGTTVPAVLAANQTGTSQHTASATATTKKTTPKVVEASTPVAAPAAPAPVLVTVNPGDYLTQIADAHGTTAVRLFYANTDITNPNLIYPGQILRIPTETEELAPRDVPANTQITPAQVAATQAPAAAPVSQSAAQTSNIIASDGSVWDQIAACESGNNWAINTGNGFYGGLQFTIGSWRAVGGSGMPNEASREEQILRGQMLQARQGWGAWPACTAKLGIR